MTETIERKPGTAVANPTASFSKFLETFKPQMALALPKHLNADRMARLTLTAFSQSEQLQRCEPRTIIASVMVAGQMGLEIGVSGQGYLVPYGTACTFVPGWQGIVDIVNRSGRATVWTGAVFEGDRFDYSLGDSPFIKHQPTGEDDPDLLTHVYAVGRVNGGEWPVIEVWPIAKVERHFKRFNKVGKRHYAFQNWEMYSRKLPLLQVCKYMPKSIELTNALTASYAAEEGKGVVIEGNFVTVSNDNGNDNGSGYDEAGEPAAPAVTMPTRRSAEGHTPATPAAATPDATPAPAAPKPAAAAAPKPAPAPKASNAEPTGEVASPALVTFLRNKVESLELSEGTVVALLEQFGATKFELLTPANALAMKNELAAQGA